ncbi:hypothetical protein ACSQ67_010292 [Phaseolus vulgaris]
MPLLLYFPPLVSLVSRELDSAARIRSDRSRIRRTNASSVEVTCPTWVSKASIRSPILGVGGFLGIDGLLRPGLYPAGIQLLTKKNECMEERLYGSSHGNACNTVN